MGASKRYKGNDCAYCGVPGSSSTNDHVIARSFFPNLKTAPIERMPQVPACAPCNNKKSLLEAYVVSALLIGSRHEDANRYRRDKIRPRLDRNQKLREELNIDAPPVWAEVNGIMQLMHVVKIDSEKVTRLLQLIIRGLYHYHFGKPLPPEMVPDVTMIRPEAEELTWLSVSHFFPPGSPRIASNLGRGTFVYYCVQSLLHEGLTAWVIGLHGQIPLHGQDGSSDHWWCITRPTPEALASAKKRLS